MKSQGLIRMAALFTVCFGAGAGFAAAPAAPQPAKVAKEAKASEGSSATIKVPLFTGSFGGIPIAQVGDEVILLRDLSTALVVAHEAHTPSDKGGAKQYTAILERLINVRLMLLEARSMELDKLPEVVRDLENFRAQTLRQVLQGRIGNDAKPDPEEVEKLYKEAVKEWKLRSVLFEKEEDATKAAAAIKSGKSFDEVAKQLVADKTATGNEAAEFLKTDKMLPQARDALRKIEVGAVTAPVKIPTGFAVLKLEEIRFPDDPKVKSDMEGISLERSRSVVLKKYMESLLTEYVKADQKLFARLDFEAKKPGFAALAKDTRVLARIKGGKTITVADLAGELEKKYFHGLEQPIRDKKVNLQKQPLFEALVHKAILELKALEMGIDQTEEFKAAVAEYRATTLFGTFVQKALVPGLSVSEDEIKKHYEQNAADYTYSEFLKISTLGFTQAKDAQEAVRKLKAGADFGWLKANADGQIKPEERLMDFDNNTVSVKGLGPDLGGVLGGARKGDVRLYPMPDGKQYVIYIREQIPPQKQPLQEVKSGIKNKLYGLKVNQALADWADRLRKVTEVKVYLTGVGK